MTPGGPNLLRQVAGLTARLMASGENADRAARQAYGLIFQSIIAQATTLAYLDTFLVLSGLSAIMFVISFALRKNQPGGGRVVLE